MQIHSLYVMCIGKNTVQHCFDVLCFRATKYIEVNTKGEKSSCRWSWGRKRTTEGNQRRSKYTIFLFCFSLFLSLWFHIQYIFAHDKSMSTARLPNCWKLRDTKRRWEEGRLSTYWNLQAPKFLSMQRFKLEGIPQAKEPAGRNVASMKTWVLVNFSEGTASPLPLLLFLVLHLYPVPKVRVSEVFTSQWTEHPFLCCFPQNLCVCSFCLSFNKRILCYMCSTPTSCRLLPPPVSPSSHFLLDAQQPISRTNDHVTIIVFSQEKLVWTLRFIARLLVC